MGLFSKKTKARPTIETQGLRIEYDPNTEIWQFKNNALEFVTYGQTCVLPSRDQLAEIHSDVHRLHPEMLRKLTEGWKDWKGVKMNDGETVFINITNFHSQGSFDVCWSGGESWGDMGIDFTIKDHQIIDTSWGD